MTEVGFTNNERGKTMKRITRTIICIVMSVVFMVICVPFKSEAKDIYNTSTLKQNTWKKIKSVSYSYKNDEDYFDYYYYKITVPSNGYIKFDISGKSSYNIEIVRKLSKNTYDHCAWFDDDSKPFYIALPKGTYYLHNSHGDNEPKVRWSFVKASNPTNYCRAKAKTLASNKKETIVFNDGYEYDRWYKITLKKKQPITAYYSCLDYRISPTSPYFSVYTAKGERINCPEFESGKSFKTPIQNKGTYYIKVEKRSDWDTTGRIRTLRWK
jgi:hypothetical protein